MPDGDNSAFFIDHQLVDYDTWYETFSSHQSTGAERRAKHGTLPVRLLRDIEDRNHAVMVILAPNREAVESLMAEPALQENFANTEI